jgi:HD-GYP domain-containing protein (c-di-GMP phosphodiesterase class II)
LSFDLYLRPKSGNSVVLYRERSYPMRAEDKQKLLSSDIRTLYIRTEAHDDYRQYLLDQVINNKEVPSAQRYKVLTEATRAIFDQVVRFGNTNRMVEFAAEFGQQMADVIGSNPKLAEELLPLMAHDYYTYTHLANVCTYSLLLAAALGVTNQESLTAIGTGAMLHDLGKRHVSAAVLNHRGRLNDRQQLEMQMHPTHGFRDLVNGGQLSWGQLMMVYQHHERPDGQGYPTQVTESEIHEWARICKIADVFDALTCERPYRKASSPEWTLSYMLNRSGAEFDKDMMQCFQLMLSWNA